MKLFVLLPVLLVIVLPVKSYSQGEKVYSSCVECHGDKALGIEEKNAPKLAGQHSWYIETQLLAFKSGERKYKNSAICADSLSKEDIKTVATYLKGL